MSSSSIASRSATRRNIFESPPDPKLPSNAADPVADPPPTPRPVSQLLAFGLIIVLALLQFLPATHFRDASDPFRKWVAFDSFADVSKASKDIDPGLASAHGEEDKMVHIVSWMDCLDLRLLAILANSTLSSSRYPELVHFHFFVPEELDEKVSYYKLKVLFPHSNLELLGQRDVKEAILAASSAGEHIDPSIDEIAPFAIPIIHPSLSKFIYVSQNVIMKGRVEELLRVDLSNYGVAMAEDCSKRLSDYANSDVLDAIQRSASKPWVSSTSYAANACMPELGVVLFNAAKLEKDLVEAILWWSRVLNSKKSNPNPAVALALWTRHMNLPSSWKLGDYSAAEIKTDSSVLRYGNEGNVCTTFSSKTVSQTDIKEVLTTYLPPQSDQILGN